MWLGNTFAILRGIKIQMKWWTCPKVYCSPSCNRVVATTTTTQEHPLISTNYPIGSYVKIILWPFKMETGPPHYLLPLMSVSSPFHSLHGKGGSSQSRGMRPVLMVHSVRTQKSKIPSRLHSPEVRISTSRSVDADQEKNFCQFLFLLAWFCVV